MVFQFGKKSLVVMSTLSFDLQRVLREVLLMGLIDFSVVCGHRGEEEQNKLYRKDLSRVTWPNSKHNLVPARAVDIYPFVRGKISYDWRHCIYLAGVVQTVGRKFGTDLRWGGNWDLDGEPVTDQDFQDLGHFEEIEK